MMRGMSMGFLSMSRIVQLRILKLSLADPLISL